MYYGAEFQAQFHWHAKSGDIRHVYIQPRSPHLNGEVELTLPLKVVRDFTRKVHPTPLGQRTPPVS